MNDILRRPQRALPTRCGSGSRTRCARVLQRYGYQNIRTPIVEPTALFVRGHRRGDRHRREGDVLLRGLDERRQADAAPGGHRRHRARGDRAQRCSTTARCACGTWARCSATSARRRAATASSTRSASRRSASPGPDIDAELIMLCARLWRDSAWDGETSAWRSTALGEPAERQRAPRRADRVFRAARDAARRGRAAPPAHQPAAHPGHQEPGDAGDGRRRAAS